MVISEQELNNIIKESIQENLNAILEAKEEANKKTDKKKKTGQIEGYFKKDGVNCAPYAYRLFGVKAKDGKDSKEMKNARSLFMKKLNHETNDFGNQYKFNSSELNRLNSLISNNQLSEAIDKAFNDVLNEEMEDEKKQPQSQPGVANNPAPAQATSTQLAETDDLDNVTPEDEMGSHPVMGSVS